MPKSMTGFARRELQAPWGTLSCEIRSVNHRYLEPIIRLPESLRALEVTVRDQCRKQLQRGKVEVNIQLNVNAASPDTLALNQTLIEQLAQAANTVTQAAADQNTQVAPIDPLRLLQWPGVIEQQNIDNDVIEASAKTLLADTLELLM